VTFGSHVANTRLTREAHVRHTWSTREAHMKHTWNTCAVSLEHMCHTPEIVMIFSYLTHGQNVSEVCDVPCVTKTTIWLLASVNKYTQYPIGYDKQVNFLQDNTIAVVSAPVHINFIADTCSLRMIKRLTYFGHLWPGDVPVLKSISQESQRTKTTLLYISTWFCLDVLYLRTSTLVVEEWVTPPPLVFTMNGMS
jgi:hypothetical protein